MKRKTLRSTPRSRTDLNFRLHYLQEVDTGRIRLTGTGLAFYGERMARVGFNPKAIRTREHLEAAIDEVYRAQLFELAEEYGGDFDKAMKRVLRGMPDWA